MAPTTNEFVPDPNKSEEENAAAKTAHEAPKPEVKPEVVPLTAEAIKLPEGFEVDAPVMDKFLEILNDAKLAPGDRANALVNLQAEATKAASEKISANWDAFNARQQEEVKADPEVGGAKLEANLAAISDLLNTHGSPELRLVMDNSGAGNNLAVVKFLTKIAGLVNEGKPVSGAPTSTAPKTQAETLYPNMKG